MTNKKSTCEQLKELKNRRKSLKNRKETIYANINQIPGYSDYENELEAIAIDLKYVNKDIKRLETLNGGTPPQNRDVLSEWQDENDRLEAEGVGDAAEAAWERVNH